MKDALSSSLLVHLLIGVLVPLGVFAVIVRAARRKSTAQNRSWILGFACVAAAVAVATGWALARSGGYDIQLLKSHQTAGTMTTGTPLDQPVFAGVIQPILQRRCLMCHGAEKHKADLRLDTLEALLQGGRSGPVVYPGSAKDSALVQRVLLPLPHDGHMPPEDQSQLTEEEIALLEWWIDAGAPGDEWVRNLKPEPKIRRLLEVVSQQRAPAD